MTGRPTAARRSPRPRPRPTRGSPWSRCPTAAPATPATAGIEQATGEYLAFVDADDMLPPHAYELLLHTLESPARTSSPATCSGSARSASPSRRCTPRRSRPGRSAPTSARHPRCSTTSRCGTSCSASRSGIAHGLVFPEGMVWEDLQVMTRAHVLARAVDVIPDPIYYWRERGKGALSITQSRTEHQQLQGPDHRAAGHRRVPARSTSPPGWSAEHQRKALVNDLWLYVRRPGPDQRQYQAEFMRADRASTWPRSTRGCSRKLPSTPQAGLPPDQHGPLAELLEFIMWTDRPADQDHAGGPRARPAPGRPAVPRGPRADIPASVYRPHWRELDPFVRVEGLELGRATGWSSPAARSCRPSTSPSAGTPPRSSCCARGARRRLPIVVPARSFRHPDATRWSGQERYSYDWAGFRVRDQPPLVPDRRHAG